MIWLLVEALIAGLILIGIVWWTIPKKEKHSRHPNNEE